MGITLTPFFMLAAAVGVLAAFVLFFFIRTELRFKRLLRGKKGKDLEGTIESLEKDIEKLAVADAEKGAYLKEVNERLARSVKTIGIVRFNPFQGTSGSNQSFAAALLDERGDGVVISSLYSREKVSVFAKPIKNGKSEYELSREEREAITRASSSTA